jgi:hypothetical protein
MQTRAPALNSGAPGGVVDLCSLMQIDPPGLYMVQLPFLDDIRNPETDPNWVGEGHPTPDKDAVDAAADMIAALSLPDFFSGMLPNPSLQRHYQVCHLASGPASIAAGTCLQGCGTPRCTLQRPPAGQQHTYAKMKLQVTVSWHLGCQSWDLLSET